MVPYLLSQLIRLDLEAADRDPHIFLELLEGCQLGSRLLNPIGLETLAQLRDAISGQVLLLDRILDIKLVDALLSTLDDLGRLKGGSFRGCRRASTLSLERLRLLLTACANILLPLFLLGGLGGWACLDHCHGSCPISLLLLLTLHDYFYFFILTKKE